MKTLRRLWRTIEIIFLAIAFVLTGYLAPWWGIIFPAIMAGFFAYQRERIVFSIAAISALCWITIAGVQDFETGWRISYRIASVVGLPVSVFAYLIIGLLAGLVAALAAMMGSTLRGGLEILFQSQEFRGGRPKD